MASELDAVVEDQAIVAMPDELVETAMRQRT